MEAEPLIDAMGLPTCLAVLGSLLDATDDCVKVIGPDGRLVFLNPAGRRALGIADGAALGMVWIDLLPPDVHDAAEPALARALAGVATQFSGRSAPEGGPVQHWDNALTPLPDLGGGPGSVVCVSREVTAERVAMSSLLLSEDRVAIAVAVGGMGVWDYDIRRDELDCDEQWHRIMGLDPARPLRSIDELRAIVHPEDRDRATEVIGPALRLLSTGEDYAITFRIVRPDGEVRWVRSAAQLEDDHGVPTRAIGFVVDVTDAKRDELQLLDANRELQRAQRSLTRQALEDPLTGVPNRRHLDRELPQLCRRVATSGEPLSVVLIDVDHFKEYNDRYGHLAGDEALQAIAFALRSVAGPSDLIARFGGEEFAFVLAGSADPAPAIEALFAAVAALGIEHAGSPTDRLTISCGCAVSPASAAPSPSALLAESDQALYAAKRAGRNRYVVGDGV